MKEANDCAADTNLGPKPDFVAAHEFQSTVPADVGRSGEYDVY